MHLPPTLKHLFHIFTNYVIVFEIISQNIKFMQLMFYQGPLRCQTPVRHGDYSTGQKTKSLLQICEQRKKDGK